MVTEFEPGQVLSVRAEYERPFRRIIQGLEGGGQLQTLQFVVVREAADRDGILFRTGVPAITLIKRNDVFVPSKCLPRRAE